MVTVPGVGFFSIVLSLRDVFGIWPGGKGLVLETAASQRRGAAPLALHRWRKSQNR